MILQDLANAYSCIDLTLLPSLDKLFPNRICRLAYCRQAMLDLARRAASKLDINKCLYVPVDLDSEIFSSVDINVFIEACQYLLSDRSLDALFPLSQPCYYDILALRSSGWCESDCINDLRKYQKIGSFLVNYLAWLWVVSRRQKPCKKLSKLGSLIPVDSAFGGFGIYCFESISHAQYFMPSFEPSLFDTAIDHVIFNRNIRAKAIFTPLLVSAPGEHLAGGYLRILLSLINSCFKDFKKSANLLLRKFLAV